MPHLFCFGLGYSGSVLARRLAKKGWHVSGSCMSEEKASQLNEQGFHAYLFNGETPLKEAQTALADVTHVLNSIPPNEQYDPVLRLHQADLTAIAPQLRWTGYLSTIGVYGDCNGAWIDEDHPVNPMNPASERRVKAEQQWLEFGRTNQVATHIFRLPGIYGPNGRSQLDKVKAGKARRIIKPGQVFNRIHVDDIASTLIASIEQPNGDRIYNVCDDEPAPPQDIVTYCASLLGVNPPPDIPIEEANLSPYGQRFYSECKRVNNDRIKQELGVELKFPTYREGLRAIATNDQ